ncbi:MAG TPA: M28 family peptidase [Solirubrobacteraceae bacterium]|nr:M28 family peptidase [Solirubrobacteraceae bacterium]
MIVAHRVLNGRIYRAAFLPLLFALAIAGFSLSDRPAPLSSNLAPGAFEGARAFADLQRLAARFPDRRPGGRGDDELAAYVAGVVRGLGGPAAGGFTVKTRTVRAQTIEGERSLQTVIAQRAGSTGERPLVIVAHRDAAGLGARAELSATAVLLELARIFAASETQRTIVLVSTSGGSGGNAGAADFAAHAPAAPAGGADAAIVLGNLAGVRAGRVWVSGLSAAPGSAPQLLQRTVAQAFAQQAGVAPASPSLLTDVAQLAFPLVPGEQGPLAADGLPALLVQAGGELPPAAGEPVSAVRLEALGRSVLAAVYALDAGPEVAGEAQAGLPVARKLLPGWALRLLVAALLLPPLLALCDALARRNRERSAGRSDSRAGSSSLSGGLLAGGALGRDSLAGGSLSRWLLWALACGAPFLAAALFALLLGALAVFPAPRPPVAPAALALNGSSLEATLAVALVLALAWLAWPACMRRLALPLRPSTPDAGLAVALVLAVLSVLVWLFNPVTALLLVPALHLWLALAGPAPVDSPLARRPGLWAPLLVALGLLPLGLLIAFYAAHLGLGVGGVAHTALLLLAGGRIGLGGALLWSVAAGLPVAALLAALPPPGADPPLPRWPEADPDAAIPLAPIRGPLSYAGPGSLGGTESALRR